MTQPNTNSGNRPQSYSNISVLTEPLFGVLFDMDGVIVDSNPTHKEAIQLFCRDHDLDLSTEFLENNLYGRTNREWIPELLGSMGEKELERLSQAKEKLFRDMFEPEEHMVGGLISFLDQLKESGIKTAVATSAPGENADFILSRLSISHYFDAILDSSHVTRGKPDPEPYLNAAKKIGLDASQCIVMEDSISGVKSGLNAGAKVVGVTTTHNPDELASCHLVIDHFEGLSLDDLADLFTD